jgi:hypothetical protein
MRGSTLVIRAVRPPPFTHLVGRQTERFLDNNSNKKSPGETSPGLWAFLVKNEPTSEDQRDRCIASGGWIYAMAR